MAITIEKLLVTQLANHINDRKDEIGLPCYMVIGAPSSLTGKALWLQVLGKTQPIKKYLRGKYEGCLPFAVYYRLSAAEINGVEANMIIPHEQLEEWFSDNLPQMDGFTVTDISQTKGAAIFARQPDGTIIYQSVWQIIYKN